MNNIIISDYKGRINLSSNQFYIEAYYLNMIYWNNNLYTMLNFNFQMPLKSQ